MRATPLGLLALLAASAAAVGEDRKANTVPIESPTGQLQLAVNDLAVNVSADAAPFIRYLSFAQVPPESRATFRRVFRWWFNHLSGSKALIRETEIDGPLGAVQKTLSPTLIRIDLRNTANWTRTAWILVADRDYLFREPLLPHRETVFGRLATGIEVNPDTFSAGFILNAYQLFRDTLESDRSTSYYDLLYAFERHPDKDSGHEFVVPLPVAEVGPEPKRPEARPWPGGVFPGDGKEYSSGSFQWIPKAEMDAYEAAMAKWQQDKIKANAPIVNSLRTGQATPKVALSVKDANKGDKAFPKKGADFEKRWGTDVNAADIKNFLLDPRFGGIASGRDGDTKTGSYVALNDRAIRIAASKLVPNGWGARTFDVIANIGDKDHIERFREIANNEAKADAGELLASLPNGAQAGLLVDGEDSRVEVANTSVAQIQSDKIDPRYRDVRTMMGCVACHAPNGGFNSFTEQFKNSIEKGLKFNVLDKNNKEAQKLLDFYLSWANQIKLFPALYNAYTEIATADEKGKSWTGQQTWEHLRAARDWYDQPVTIEVVAFEYGYTAEGLRKIMLGRSEKDSPIEARLNQLAVGKSIPRRTFQEEVGFKLSLYLDTKREKDDPIKEMLAPQLLEDALKKFGHAGKIIK